MVTMKLWLGQLAAGFALTAGAFASYIYSQTPDGRQAIADVRAAHPRVAEAVDTAVIAGQDALDHMIRTAMMDPSEANKARANPDAKGGAPARQIPSAELNFQVVSADPKAAAAPANAESAFVPPEAVAEPVKAASQSIAQNEAPLAGPAAAVAQLPQQAALETKPALTVAPPAAKPQIKLADGARGTERAEPVAQRIKSRVSEDMQQFFDLYLYVSKAEKGSWAQRMHVMARQPDDSLALIHTWEVSTGKEEMMKNPHGVVMNTDTPEGFFRLDRGRFFADYTSYQWKAPMPHAMFFDWQIEGRRSGLAIHGTGPDEDEMLGQRASKGCIRLSPENAEQLFKLITENYAGRVPQFKIDPVTRTQSTNGLMRRDAMGRILTKRGYRVLVVIENYGGPSTDTIATIM
jgi:lipoprotein-anchoring transpeptidase ErfK/SrfK